MDLLFTLAFMGPLTVLMFTPAIVTIRELFQKGFTILRLASALWFTVSMGWIMPYFWLTYFGYFD
ncbi:MAG: hypothetical protein Q8Q11_02615 [bacterium]|nr:hypothetical protein [bacterium]MDZ4247939.1 hypothetical protein [Patescibacteria group bacterium]